MNKKRVACLYRVSSKIQVDKFTDDIPMQQNACREFISKNPDWVLEQEYSEKGVSGYKKKANDRHVLQKIMTDASENKFDVLLVFMFDRLGRREDETPFILELFVEQGIEVWSVKEGQQRLENRGDKLMNYIRFWQSGGESEKTSMRVLEQHLQMIKEGKFCGGIAPYGYKLIKSGVENKKGRELKAMIIDEEEAEIVREVYTLATVNGWGGQRISVYLNEKGILTRKKSKWGLTVVNYMLRNPIYKGYPTYGKTSAKSGSNSRRNPKDWHISEVKVDKLAIIDESVWEKAQVIRRARTPDCYKPENIDMNRYPLQTKSNLLFTGFIKCGCCGSTMCSFVTISKWKKGGEEMRAVRPAYRCTSSNRGITCDGQTSYRANRIEEPVLSEIYNYLENLEQINFNEKINAIKKRNISKEESQLKQIETQLKKIDADIRKLNDEIVKAISGESVFTPEQLSTAINQTNTTKSELLEKKAIIEEQLSYKMVEVNKLIALQTMIPNWVSEFENSQPDVKKMMIAELIHEVVVFRDRIEVNFKIEFDDFVSMAN